MPKIPEKQLDALIASVTQAVCKKSNTSEPLKSDMQTPDLNSFKTAQSRERVSPQDLQNMALARDCVGSLENQRSGRFWCRQHNTSKHIEK